MMFLESDVDAPKTQILCENYNTDEKTHSHLDHLVICLVLMNLMRGLSVLRWRGRTKPQEVIASRE